MCRGTCTALSLMWRGARGPHQADLFAKVPAGVSPKPILIAHGKMVVKKILALQAAAAAAAAAGDAADGGESGNVDDSGAHESAPVLEGAYKHPKVVVTEVMAGHNIQFATFTVSC